MNMDDIQKVIFGKAERIYREFRDADNTLSDPTTPHITIYDPDGVEFDSGTPTKESVGVYYYSVSLSTASTTKEGIYQAYWQGTVDGIFLTEDTPQYVYGISVPWQTMQQDDVINSVRRLTGDLNPEQYRISTVDMYYYLRDAVDEVQAEYNFGYTVTVTPTALTWNKDLYSTPFVLFKLKALLLVLESTMNDFMFEAGNVQVGDIKIDVTSTLRLRQENLKRVKADYKDLMYSVKMNNVAGCIIDTYAVGRINNSSSMSDDMFYE